MAARLQDNYRSAIRQKIVDSIAAPVPALTARDVWLPAVANKAVAVIGMRRAGKTSLLWRIIGERLKLGTPREALVYFSFEDERLAGMSALDLQLVIEEYYKLTRNAATAKKPRFCLTRSSLSMAGKRLPDAFWILNP